MTYLRSRLRRALLGRLATWEHGPTARVRGAPGVAAIPLPRVGVDLPPSANELAPTRLAVDAVACDP